MNEKTKTVLGWSLKIIFIPAILLLLYLVWKYRKKLFKKWYHTEEPPYYVQFGDKTDAVLKLQQALNKCWQNTLKEDGVLGPITHEALNKAGYKLPLLKNKFDEIVSKC